MPPMMANNLTERRSQAPAFPVPQLPSHATIWNEPNASHVRIPEDGKADENRKYLCETLVYPEGEIPVLDRDDGSWKLIYFEPLASKNSGNHHWWNHFGAGSGTSWTDASGALSDNYFLLIKQETSPTGTTESKHMIRPIPLECLRLASFNKGPETRKKDLHFLSKAKSRFKTPTEPMYPLTVYHAAAKITHRHTLYAKSETERNRWYNALVGAMEAQNPRQLYVPQTLNDGFFRMSPRIQFTRATHYTGRVLCATGFLFQWENYIAVGCTSGIYVSKRAADSAGEPAAEPFGGFLRVLEVNEPISVVAIPELNQFLVHCDSALYSYPLDMVVSVSQGTVASIHLDSSMEKWAGEHEHVSFLKAGRVANQSLVIYAAKSSQQFKLHVLEPNDRVQTPANDRPSYRRLGSPTSILDVPHDATFFQGKIAICASKAIYLVELTNASVSLPTAIPEFGRPKRVANPFLRILKRTTTLLRLGRSDVSKILQLLGKASILGMVTYQNDILLVYDGLGCFIDKDGKPAGSCYYIEWERRATAYARRGSHLLLFSSGHIEVHSIDTGKLVRIMEGNELRYLRSGSMEPGILMAAMTGHARDDGGHTEKIVELVYHDVNASDEQVTTICVT